jgi:hypothetical protein
MQLIAAKITGKPRNVTTRQGDRSVVDARANNGENLTIWRPANDPAVMRLANGERVQLAIDSKGKVSLIDTAATRAEEAAGQPMGFTIEPAAPPVEKSRSAEIAEHLDKLSKLYSVCLSRAESMPKPTELPPEATKDIATTLYLSLVKKFDL